MFKVNLQVFEQIFVLKLKQIRHWYDYSHKKKIQKNIGAYDLIVYILYNSCSENMIILSIFLENVDFLKKILIIKNIMR